MSVKCLCLETNKQTNKLPVDSERLFHGHILIQYFPPIKTHLHFRNEIPHSVLTLTTLFLETGQACWNAPVELEIQF